MNPQPNINTPVSFSALKSLAEIDQSLQIFQRTAESNLQMVTAIQTFSKPTATAFTLNVSTQYLHHTTVQKTKRRRRCKALKHLSTTPSTRQLLLSKPR